MAVSVNAQAALVAARSLLAGVFRLLVWSVTVAPVHVYRAASVLATPLTFPLYYVFRAVVFLLSPVTLVVSSVARTGSWLIDVAARTRVSSLPCCCALAAAMLASYDVARWKGRRQANLRFHLPVYSISTNL